jgi:hypothetical protein
LRRICKKGTKDSKECKASKEEQRNNPVKGKMHSSYKKCIPIQKKVPQKKNSEESRKTKLKI